MDRCPFGSISPTALASWEEIFKVITDFQKTRDCQSIAGFLLNQSRPEWAAQEKEENENEI
jgi:hypothetical protein